MESTYCEPCKRNVFNTAIAAMKHGERENLLYVACSPVSILETNSSQADFVATIDVNPTSKSYGKVIHRLPMPNVGDEISHLGWNTCMGCYGEDDTARHEKMIVTSLRSSTIYMVNVKNQKSPSLEKVIGDKEIRCKSGLTRPGVTHCLGFGKVMVAASDDEENDGKCNKGGFIELDVVKGEICGRWDNGDKNNTYPHDFWYQIMTYNVIASTTGWELPNIYNGNTKLKEALSEAPVSGKLLFWDFDKRNVIQTVALGPEGAVPSTVRFLHDATKAVGFAASMRGDGIFKFWKNEAPQWEAKKFISIPNTNVNRLGSENLPAMTVDMVLSLDDKFLYCSNWLSKEIHQYNISDLENPRLCGKVCIDGMIKDKAVRGGPANMTLSLDGRRLYVTTSLFSTWDKEVYPEMATHGSVLLMIDVDMENERLSLNPDFIVDFQDETTESSVPVFAKQLRYPGGDCTSEIFLSF